MEAPSLFKIFVQTKKTIWYHITGDHDHDSLPWEPSASSVLTDWTNIVLKWVIPPERVFTHKAEQKYQKWDWKLHAKKKVQVKVMLLVLVVWKLCAYNHNGIILKLTEINNCLLNQHNLLTVCSYLSHILQYAFMLGASESCYLDFCLCINKLSKDRYSVVDLPITCSLIRSSLVRICGLQQHLAFLRTAEAVILRNVSLN
jgi:hypothetical protein